MTRRHRHRQRAGRPAWPGDLPLAGPRRHPHRVRPTAAGGDYVGPTLNMAARLRGLADGGEVFLSRRHRRPRARPPARRRRPGRPRAAPPARRARARGGVRRRRARRAHPAAARRVPVPRPARRSPRRTPSASSGARRWSPTSSTGSAGTRSSPSSARRAAASRRCCAPASRRSSASPTSSRPGTAAARRARRAVDGLLVVDQFEELFTARRRRRRARPRSSTGCWPGPTPWRSACGPTSTAPARSTPGLAAAVARHQVLLGPMAPTSCGAAITEPATRAGLRVEPGLVDVLVREVAGEPGALPLLSHALRATWEARDGRTLTLDAYRVDRRRRGRHRRHRRRCGRRPRPGGPGPRPPLFLRLVEPGDGAPDTRRRAQLSELLPAGGDARRIGTGPRRGGGARLVTMDDAGVEVAHEALIREWPRLRSWLDEDRDGLRLQRQVTAAAAAWDAAAGGTPASSTAGRGSPPPSTGWRPSPRSRRWSDEFLDESRGGESGRRRAAGAHQPPAAPPSHADRAWRSSSRSSPAPPRSSRAGARRRPATAPRCPASRPVSRSLAERQPDVGLLLAAEAFRRRRRRRHPEHAAHRARGAPAARGPALRQRVGARGGGVHARRRSSWPRRPPTARARSCGTPRPDGRSTSCATRTTSSSARRSAPTAGGWSCRRSSRPRTGVSAASRSGTSRPARSTGSSRAPAAGSPRRSSAPTGGGS